jgi:hypothetical protein
VPAADIDGPLSWRCPVRVAATSRPQMPLIHVDTGVLSARGTCGWIRRAQASGFQELARAEDNVPRNAFLLKLLVDHFHKHLPDRRGSLGETCLARQECRD